jgi:hypothetical protein
MCGRDVRSVSKEKGNAATYTQVLRLAPSHWALATMQPRRDSKIMTSKRRKLSNRRPCFLFRIEGMEAVGCTATICFARRYQRRARMTVWQLALNFSAKEFFADCPPASIGLLRRAAETDREAANLLSVHPRSVDGAILLVHLLG